MEGEDRFKELPEPLNRISGKIVDCAYRLHKTLGPGLLENVYETCLEFELKKCGLDTERQTLLPLVYDTLRVDNAFRVDLWVERSIIVEVKAVEDVIDLHEAQLLTYLKLTQCRLGLLLNFNSPLMRDGIIRRVI